jgi:hypothetical protein
VSKGRTYRSGAEKALFLLSRGYCYEPSCKTPVIRIARGGEPRVNVQIAHICALEEDGPRHDKNLKDPNHFRNLILLCQVHHTEIDREPTCRNYTVGLLNRWKSDREGGLAKDLEGLTGLTEAELEGKLAGVVAEVRAGLTEAINEVAKTSQDMADTLRVLMTEVFERPYLDPDTVAALAYSARVFEGLPDHAVLLSEASRSLGQLPDHAPILYEASLALRNLPDDAATLYEAARALQSVPDYVSVLGEAAQAFRELPDHTWILHQATSAFQNLPDHAPMLRDAARSIEDSHFGNLPNHASQLD